MKTTAGYRLAVVLLALSTTVYASSEGNSWKKVRYNGGTLQTKVDPKDCLSRGGQFKALRQDSKRERQELETNPPGSL